MIDGIFSFPGNYAYEMACVETAVLTDGSKIPAILLGVVGERMVVPVHLSPESYEEWREYGQLRIQFAEVSQASHSLSMRTIWAPPLQSGISDICLNEATWGDNVENCLIVFRAEALTGDRLPDGSFLPFPGEILVESAKHYLVRVPRDRVFRVHNRHFIALDHFLIYRGGELERLSSD